MPRLVEIRALRLKPGTFATFARLYVERSLPIHRRQGIDVVAFGGSPDDPDVAFVIRSFADLADRRRREAEFYASDAWRKGPREAMLACLDSYVDTLITLDETTVEGLRAAGIADAPREPPDRVC